MNHKDEFEIEVPTKQYIKKYMEVTHGDPISIDRKEPHGKLLFSLLERNSHERDSEYTPYPVMMRIRLQAKMYHRKGTMLTSSSIIEFNNTVDKDLKKLLLVYVYAQLNSPNPRKKKHAIESFMKTFRLEPSDWPYDSAIKYVDRNIHGLIN